MRSLPISRVCYIGLVPPFRAGPPKQLGTSLPPADRKGEPNIHHPSTFHHPPSTDSPSTRPSPRRDQLFLSSTTDHYTSRGLLDTTTRHALLTARPSRGVAETASTHARWGILDSFSSPAQPTTTAASCQCITVACYSPPPPTRPLERNPWGERLDRWTVDEGLRRTRKSK